MIRKVTTKTKEIVYERDGGRCVCCGRSYPLERTPHHAYYGGEANYGANRNDPDQLVTICLDCHRDIHFTGDPENKRQKCKEYLINYYS